MRVLAAILLALALGLGSAFLAVRSGLAGGEVRVGPWRTSLTTGSASAGLYTRARVAVGGLLALAPSETIYFTAASDADGEPLRADCDYLLEGGELPARWWSITAYGADHFLIPNAAGRYSISKTTVARGADGRWRARVSTQPGDGNWIPSGDPGARGAISLTARLYNPQANVARDPASAALPSLARDGCR
jgi:hypothetical protein